MASRPLSSAQGQAVPHRPDLGGSARADTWGVDTRRTDIWRADQLAAGVTAVQATGWAELDRELPGGGWPVGQLCELMHDSRQPTLPWQLLAPALRTLSSPPAQVQAPPLARKRIKSAPGHGRKQALTLVISPPCEPYGPALRAQGIDPDRLLRVQAAEPAARLWAAEQALHCRDVAAVLVWLPEVRSTDLRRLHWAAQSQDRLVFAIRARPSVLQASPAVLRVLVEHDPLDGAGLQVSLLKRRGPPLADALRLPARAPVLQAALAAARARQVERREARSPLARPAPGVPVTHSHAVDRAESRVC